MRRKDYYDLLGVPKTAEDTEIKKAYKKLALRFHPDKNSVKGTFFLIPGSKEVFNKVSNAYTVLTDKNKRAHYDRYGPEEDRAPQHRAHAHHHTQHGFNQEDEFE